MNNEYKLLTTKVESGLLKVCDITNNIEYKLLTTKVDSGLLKVCDVTMYRNK